jgi:hypothetical protein
MRTPVAGPPGNVYIVAGVVSLQLDVDGFRASDKVTIAIGSP